MNCREARSLMPLYLSGESEGEVRPSFAAHLAACRVCEREIEGQALLDERLAGALSREQPDTARIERFVRRHMSASRSRRRWIRWGAMAASAIVAIAGTYALLRRATAPPWYADAARDHRAEVVDNQPRRWRSGEAEIDILAAQNGLSVAQVSALAPAGYSLEHAKTCGIGGQRMLHLVFTNGTRKYSIYVRPHRSAEETVRIVQRSPEQVAGFETGRFSALVVTSGDAAECEELARLVAGRL